MLKVRRELDKESQLIANESEPVVPRIEFRNVSLAYDDRVVLDDVSFLIWPAELKLMLGESGGGKSTVIKLTLGLEKPDAGEILIDGEEIAGLSEEKLQYVMNRKLFCSMNLLPDSILQPQEPFVSWVSNFGTCMV